jgi:hypothetical protein
VAEKTAEAETTRDRAQQKSDKKFFSRMFNKLGRQTKQIKIKPVDEAAVERLATSRMAEVKGDVEKLLALREYHLRGTPGGSEVAAQIESIYGNPLLRNPENLAKQVDEVSARLERSSPRQRLIRLGAALQARYTQQLKDERPEFDKLLAHGSNQALLKEFDEIVMKDLPTETDHEDVQAQGTYEAGGESHSTSSMSHSTSTRGLFKRTNDSVSVSNETDSEWHAHGESLLPGATQYTVHVKQPGSAGKGMLPFEARLYLEDAIRAADLAHELSKLEEKRGVGAVRPWLKSTVRFVVHNRDLRDVDESDLIEMRAVGVENWVRPRAAIAKEGYGVELAFRVALTDFASGPITPARVEAFAKLVSDWHARYTKGANDTYKTVIVQMDTPKTGVLELSELGLVDKERAAMFKDAATKNLAKRLK